MTSGIYFTGTRALLVDPIHTSCSVCGLADIARDLHDIHQPMRFRVQHLQEPSATVVTRAYCSPRCSLVDYQNGF